MMTNSRASGRARVVKRAPRGARREKAHVTKCVQMPRFKNILDCEQNISNKICIISMICSVQ